MRVVRDRKYPLLLKFALRLAQANRVLPGGPTPAARLLLGASMPADRAAAIQEVVELLGGGSGGKGRPAISIQTAVRMLIAAGLPIDSAEQEVERIQRAMFEQAVQLVEATGD